MRKEIYIEKIVCIHPDTVVHNHMDTYITHGYPMHYFCDKYSKYYKFNYLANMLNSTRRMRLVQPKNCKGYQLEIAVEKHKKTIWKQYSTWITTITPCTTEELMERLL